MALDGATRLHFILGDPIAQVKSPGGMSAEFAARGLNAVMLPLHVAPADFAGVVAAMTQARNVDGLIATIPHKFAAYGACASTSERSRILGVVNVMRRNDDGTWHGDMIDGLGLASAILAGGGTIAGKRCLMVGAGGAGSAIALALLDEAAGLLAIHDSDAARRDALIGRLAPVHPGRVVVGSADPSGFDVIVNATPAGMRPGDALPLDVAKLTPAMFAACVITAPEVPAWLAEARAAGCRTATGTEMFDCILVRMADYLLRVG